MKDLQILFKLNPIILPHNIYLKDKFSFTISQKMEPKKLLSTIGVFITTLTAIILFVIEYDKIINFFFPKSTTISIPLYILTIVVIAFVVFITTYTFYYKEKSKRETLEIDLKNISQLFVDSEKLRLIDHVTGIPNELKFKIDLENRHKELFHLILIDLDGFGSINKKHGFQNGDKVIRTIAQEVLVKMRRDEEIYKRNYKLSGNFVKRFYRKYTGGDEFIFLIKGEQFEALGFLTRMQKQLLDLNLEKQIELDYKVKFHAAIVSLYPNDTYKQAIDKLQRAFIQAAEEKDKLRVFWDKEIEQKYKDKYGFIYDQARKQFKT